MARFTDTPKYARERAALAWLNVPRTSVQVAKLIGVTHNHAAALCRRLWMRGLAIREGDRRAYSYRRADVEV